MALVTLDSLRAKRVRDQSQIQIDGCASISGSHNTQRLAWLNAAFGGCHMNLELSIGGSVVLLTCNDLLPRVTERLGALAQQAAITTLINPRSARRKPGGWL
jgi:hypothetical protein